MNRLLIISGIIFVNLTPNLAWAYCSQPMLMGSQRVPDAPGSYDRPDQPYCMTSGDGCEQWEIDSYINEVERYIDKLNEFIDESSAHAKKVITYANEASEYAQCEVDEIKRGY